MILFRIDILLYYAWLTKLKIIFAHRIAHVNYNNIIVAIVNYYTIYFLIPIMAYLYIWLINFVTKSEFINIISYNS